MKTLPLVTLFVLAALGALIMSATKRVPVRTGSSFLCVHCGKQDTDLRSVTVPAWKKGEVIPVRRSRGLCQRCGDELVARRIEYRCEACHAFLSTGGEQVRRRDGADTQQRRAGFCNALCEAKRHAGNLVDGASEEAGYRVGRAARNLAEGIQRAAAE